MLFTLTDTEALLFQGFKVAHPECRNKQRAFEYLKPWNVKPLKIITVVVVSTTSVVVVEISKRS